MTDIIIIGHGPAGISAALYTARAGLDTLIIGKDAGALMKAERIENYYGHALPLTGASLVDAGIAQAERLGVKVITGEVVGLRLDEYFTVETTNGLYESRGVILATGAARTAPDINGLAAYEGRGVSYCAVCDAFFYRSKDVAVLGNANYALNETRELLPIVRSVTLLTNGAVCEADFPPEVSVYNARLRELTGNPRLESVVFEDGEACAVSGLFIAAGIAGSTELARKIGAITEAGRIVTDNKQRTSVPGLWAAGDCTGGMKQIVKAAYEGAVAGTDAVKYIREVGA